MTCEEDHGYHIIDETRRAKRKVMSSFTFDGIRAILPFPATFPLECKSCQISIVETSFKRDFLRHSKKCRQRPVVSAEAKDVVFECVYCGLLSQDKRKATTHQGVHFGDPSMTVMTHDCATCNNSFGTQKALSSHKRQCKQSGAVRSQLSRRAAKSGRKCATGNHSAQQRPECCCVPEMTTCVAVPVDDDEMAAAANVSLRSVSSVPLDESVDQELYDDYTEMEDDLDMVDSNDWMNGLLPPKTKKSSGDASENMKAQYERQQRFSKMSPADLQKLYWCARTAR